MSAPSLLLNQWGFEDLISIFEGKLYKYALFLIGVMGIGLSGGVFEFKTSFILFDIG